VPASCLKAEANLALVRAQLTGWRMHVDALPGKPDFYFPAQRVAVFVDGCFWHGCPRCGHVPKSNSVFWAAKIARNRKRDRTAVQQLLALSVVTLRIWEHEPKKAR
jgi:DNA mismatch endonuclease Vsr